MLDNQAYNPVIIGATITIAVAIIGNTITIVNSTLARKNEHKLAILKILLEAGYKEYEFRTKQDIEIANSKGEEPKIKSFMEYIIFYKELSVLFAKTKVREDDLILSLKKNKILIDSYYENREIYRPEYHQEINKQKSRNNFLKEIISLFS
jgi:hypothetical protein